MVTVLNDDDIRSRLAAADAVRWMGEAIDAHHRGELVAPPRAHTDLGEGRLIFTTGRLRGSWFGYRSYDTFPASPGEQVVVVHDEATGLVRAVVTGNELGPRRTGAIGGVAAQALSPPDAAVAAIIGTGNQAYTQLWALAAVRGLTEVRIFSRDPGHREAFARRARALTTAACHAVATAKEAVRGAQIVILATSSPAPVIETGWLAPGAYVSTLGPKQHRRAEFGPDLAAAAGLLVTDSPAQMDAYDPPNVLAGTPHVDRMVSLGAVRAGEVAPAAPGERRVFFSVGLAGTEAYLADRLAAAAVRPAGRWLHGPALA
jgi:ornithine cyclodeaminase/alanine dehydrogenase-like protein (mu-crystallin family)